MPKDTIDPFSPEAICRNLKSRHLISQSRYKEILRKKDALIKKLEKQRKTRYGSDFRITHPLTIIDVIVALNMKRADDPLKPLDEDAVYKALSTAWHFERVPATGVADRGKQVLVGMVPAFGAAPHFHDVHSLERILRSRADLLLCPTM